MPGLLSKSALRSGGSNTYIQLSTAQPQLPPTPTTSTGYTVVTDSKLVTSYRTSLGNIEMNLGTMFCNIPNQNITLAGTGTGVIVVAGGTASTSTNTGALVVEGGIGTSQDIFINGIQIGQGFEGYNNIAIRGQASPIIVDANDGQENITIGYDSMLGIATAYKSIAVGRYSLNSGTNLSETIAIGDSSLQSIGSLQLWPIGDITDITSAYPAVITVANHGLQSGTEVKITGLTDGPVEINDQNLWVNVINTNTLALYVDNILYQPLDTSALPAYVGGGTLGRVLSFNYNIGVGVNAGLNLLEGEKNLFLGARVAQYLTTGSYNLFFGHEVANNMTCGSGNISIGGDNLIDGMDNQVNIGSVFYFDGGGNLYLNGDTVIGLGTNSTSTTTGALSVVGGAGITNDLYVGGKTYTAIEIKGGDAGSLPYQTSSTSTDFLPIGNPNQVLIVDPATNLPIWANSSNISSQNATNADNVNVNLISTGTLYYLSLESLIGDYSPIYGDFALTYDTTDDNLSVTKVSVTSTVNASSTITGALTVAGGVGVQGSIYSADGNPQENYKLYTPKVSVTNTGIPPLNPNVGDFWIDTTVGGELQYIQDGANSFWIQITTI